MRRYLPEDLKKEIGCKSDYIGFWVAERQEKRDWKIVGCIALYHLPDSILSYFPDCKSYAVSLERMYVANHARRRGIGSELMLHAINQASNMGFKEIFLDTSDVKVEAINLYKKNGFEIVVEKPWPNLFRFPKVNYILMKKVLTQ
ncbi:N-acetyltransferase 8-like [Styela clava]